MAKQKDHHEMFEFRLQFYHRGSDFIDNRHFTAVTGQSAIEMFEFACGKEELDVEVVKVESGIVGLIVGKMWKNCRKNE